MNSSYYAVYAISPVNDDGEVVEKFEKEDTIWEETTENELLTKVTSDKEAIEFFNQNKEPWRYEEYSGWSGTEPTVELEKQLLEVVRKDFSYNSIVRLEE